MACARKLLTQLKDEMDKGSFSSAKAIDAYQELKGKNFLDLIMAETGEKRPDSVTLAKLLAEYCNVAQTVMKELDNRDLRLANRYLESYVFSHSNSAVSTAAEREGRKPRLPRMSERETAACIRGAGQYVIDRFLAEQRQAMDASLTIPPILDLEDRENGELTGELSLGDGDTMTVGELLEYNFRIPVIQRDYCMGARIGEKQDADDFLGYLLKNFRAGTGNGTGKEVIASTILVAVEKNTGDIYVFDGQQRLYTVYQLLVYCGEAYAESKFTFAGRKNNGLSKYSQEAAENLRKALKSRVKEEEKDGLLKFLLEKVRFKVKTVGGISAAEQFFMDINGGVPLENYEIFKSCLCTKLESLVRTDLIEKLENEWLEWFYNFLGIRKDDESDTEELIEMRFIEFLCRFLIGRRKNPKVPASFDSVGSKSDLVGKLHYLDGLTKEDANDICQVMSYLTDPANEVKEPGKDKELPVSPVKPENPSNPYQFCTKGGKNENWILMRCYLLGQKDKPPGTSLMDSCKEYILNRFILSLSDGNRDKLKQYYSWKDVSSLTALYDTDLLLRDCILCIAGKKVEVEVQEKYPYEETTPVRMHFCSGYNRYHKVRKYYSSITYSVVLEGPASIPKEEIPAYYVKDLYHEAAGNYVRLHYLYAYARRKLPEEAFSAASEASGKPILNFMITAPADFVIKKENGNSTYLAFLDQATSHEPQEETESNDVDNLQLKITKDDETEVIVKPTKQTDAFLLKSAAVLNTLKYYRLLPTKP